MISVIYVIQAINTKTLRIRKERGELELGDVWPAQNLRVNKTQQIFRGRSQSKKFLSYKHLRSKDSYFSSGSTHQSIK